MFELSELFRSRCEVAKNGENEEGAEFYFFSGILFEPASTEMSDSVYAPRVIAVGAASTPKRFTEISFNAGFELIFANSAEAM